MKNTTLPVRVTAILRETVKPPEELTFNILSALEKDDRRQVTEARYRATRDAQRKRKRVRVLEFSFCAVAAVAMTLIFTFSINRSLNRRLNEAEATVRAVRGELAAARLEIIQGSDTKSSDALSLKALEVLSSPLVSSGELRERNESKAYASGWVAADAPAAFRVKVDSSVRSPLKAPMASVSAAARSASKESERNIKGSELAINFFGSASFEEKTISKGK